MKQWYIDSPQAQSGTRIAAILLKSWIDGHLNVEAFSLIVAFGQKLSEKKRLLYSFNIKHED
ncbi:hypothetical protein OYT88_15545 [Sporolactobacillus sp. CQH2019]|uniref:hypothetical protein n=1 Tax=Sporolactobacillus sp. CQH2019 TaxID=3023512 RepID=UPI0023677CBB|nr:hypothetical protein [Sporolactobacillus sp. CQH2019]MDD9149965.1 hypothetical protein [Sporolactobacillus sp. CQH2019]